MRADTSAESSPESPLPAAPAAAPGLSRRFLANLAGSWAAMALRLPVALLLTPFLIARLGDERYGAFGVLLALLAYLNLGGGPLDSSIGREYAHAGADPGRRSRVFASAVTVSGLVAAATALAGFSLAGPFTDLLRIPAAIRADALACYQALIVSVLVSQLATPFLGILMSRNRYDLLDLVSAAGQVAYALLAVAAFAWRGASLAHLGFAFLVSHLLATSILVTLALPALGGVRPALGWPDRRELRALLGFSGELLIINICVLLTFQTDNLIISRMIGVAAVAHYTVAANLITRFRQLTYGLSRSFMPATADRAATPDRRRELHFRGTRYGTLLVCGLGGVSAAVAGPFFELWLGESYRSSALIFVLLVTANIVGMSQYVTNAVLTGLRHTRPLMVSEVVGAVGNLLLSIVLVKAGFGLVGVALGTLVTMVLRNAWLALHGARVVGAPLARYVGRIYVPAALVLAATVLPLRALVARGWIGGWPELLAAGTAGCLLFGALAALFALDAEDRRLLRALRLGLRPPGS